VPAWFEGNFLRGSVTTKRPALLPVALEGKIFSTPPTLETPTSI